MKDTTVFVLFSFSYDAFFGFSSLRVYARIHLPLYQLNDDWLICHPKHWTDRAECRHADSYYDVGIRLKMDFLKIIPTKGFEICKESIILWPRGTNRGLKYNKCKMIILHFTTERLRYGAKLFASELFPLLLFALKTRWHALIDDGRPF